MRNARQATDKDAPRPSKSSVSLSGLLNVIDGVNAAEGRLLIMTTNHPEKLDPALYRAGRIERKFELGYASKASALLTFKRLFDNDIPKHYTSEAIDRFATAVQTQFPSYSKVTTAELGKYCGQYRGRPDKAVEEFADWLKRGADKFTLAVDYTSPFQDDGNYNIPEPFDRTLLTVLPSDLVEAQSASVEDSAVATSDTQSAVSHRWWSSIIRTPDDSVNEYARLPS